ncbi:hypothetical protein ABT121_08735 [Streptomyces sp. NPDC001928]|uniref:hypothetical protein n=1 Tax=Streptomyces sp. NPDC001928 TaxID=3154404 RepID=UPI00332601B3
MIIDHRVLVSAHVSHGCPQLSRRLSQVLAHQARKGDAVRTPLLQSCGQMRGMSLLVRLGQLHRNRSGKRAGMPPKPLDRPDRRP